MDTLLFIINYVGQTFFCYSLEKNLVTFLYVAPLLACFYVLALSYVKSVSLSASGATGSVVDNSYQVAIYDSFSKSLFTKQLEFERFTQNLIDIVFYSYISVVCFLLVFSNTRALRLQIGDSERTFSGSFGENTYTVDLIANREFQLLSSTGSDLFSQVSFTNIALWLIVLTFFVIYYSYYYVKNASENQYRRHELYICLLFLLSGISLVFLTDNILLFYVGFESTLIPMFYMILRFGSRSRKSLAANYIFLYTVAGSLLFLMVIIILYLVYGELNIYTLAYRISSDTEFLSSNVYACCAILTFVAFSVKVPMMPFHIWLPEAHVEAPTVGSVVLAGLLLKLGGFGFIKFFFLLFSSYTYSFGSIFLILFILSSVYSSIIVLTQDDVKKAIAYASISHMNGAMLGLFSLTKVGKCATIFYMIGHGFISSALFFLIGMLYSRLGTRDIKNFGGLASRMPLYANISLAMWLANMGFPGTVNFISEFFIVIGLVQVNLVLALLLVPALVISAVYSVWLFGKINFGSLNNSIKNFYDLTYFEFTLVGLLLVFILILGVVPGLVINSFSLESFIKV